jgi:hypothetical protein
MKAYWRRPSQAATGCAASAITVTLTSASVRGVGVPDERAVIARRCRDVFDVIRSLCRTAAARAAVGDQIKQASCGVNRERPRRCAREWTARLSDRVGVRDLEQ